MEKGLSIGELYKIKIGLVGHLGLYRDLAPEMTRKGTVLRADPQDNSYYLYFHSKKDRTYLEIIFLKISNILSPEIWVFVHWRPIEMAKKNLLFVLIK